MKKDVEIQKLLDSNTVLIVGNGINRHWSNISKSNDPSWEQILTKISVDVNAPINHIPLHFPFTEIFDIIRSNADVKVTTLKRSFAEELCNIKGTQIHKSLLDLCINKDIGIITTNFDSSFESAYEFTKNSKPGRKGFSNYYPWQISYANKKLPESNCQIWHIQGDIKYINSLRLTVHDYSLCFEYFRNFDPLIKKSRYHTTPTCFRPFFEKKLVILGLALGEQEFFLRSLIYKKKRFMKTNHIGYYLYCLEDNDLFKDGKETTAFARLKYFADSVGLQLIEYSNWDIMYKFDE